MALTYIPTPKQIAPHVRNANKPTAELCGLALLSHHDGQPMFNGRPLTGHEIAKGRRWLRRHEI